jgi:hypothetical protein
MMGVQFSPARPAEGNNGLDDLHDALMKPTADPIVAVVVITRTKRVFGDADTEDADYPVVRFTRVEPLAGDEAAEALSLLENAHAARTGKQALDLPATEDSDAEFEAAAPPVDEVAAKRGRKPKAGA